MLGFTQYGSRLFGIDASSDPSKFCNEWPSKSRLIVKFQNQKLAKNGEFDIHEKGEFAFAIFRHSPPPHDRNSNLVARKTINNLSNMIGVNCSKCPIAELSIYLVLKTCRRAYLH